MTTVVIDVYYLTKICVVMLFNYFSISLLRSSQLSLLKPSYTQAYVFYVFSLNFSPLKTIIKIVPPKIAPFDFGEAPSNVAESASVACLIITGDLPITFKWFFNDRPVNEYAGITTVKLGKRNSVLNIDSVTARHAGHFTCEASNQAASFNYTSHLIVNGI